MYKVAAYAKKYVRYSIRAKSGSRSMYMRQKTQRLGFGCKVLREVSSPI